MGLGGSRWKVRDRPVIGRSRVRIPPRAPFSQVRGHQASRANCDGFGGGNLRVGLTSASRRDARCCRPGTGPRGGARTPADSTPAMVDGSAARLVEERLDVRVVHFSLVTTTKPVPIFFWTGSPLSAAIACSTPALPMSAGFWAIRAWTMPCCRSSTCLGPASKPTILTFLEAPALRSPVAAPSAENRLVLHGGVGGPVAGHPDPEPEDLDAVGQLHHLRHVVADEHDRDARVAYPPDQVADMRRLDDAEGGGGLVHEHDLADPGGGPADSDALALPARQVGHHGPGVLEPDAEVGEGLVGPAAHGRLVQEPELAEQPGADQFAAEEQIGRRVELGASARSWYTVSMPSSRAATGFGMVTWRPSNRIAPPSGARVPDRILTSVLLPAPLSPTSAATSPGWTAKSAPRSARTPPKLLTMPPASSRGSLTAGSSLVPHGPALAARRSLRSGRRRCRPAAQPRGRRPG
jgi:hypothetical protein